eukprot:CAMPEP_0184684524 /NCGR_PEP_ID=MMETSP0312-20130426/15635_1 /TAXON_ID=31354 /ORGANISM="Compsopogon coeruleus, Strain SAG 36.94" /LENGTH=35 /DNA_ID= /DNA_START= /DNA_END= /DNA_ORIENTATION=
MTHGAREKHPVKDIDDLVPVAKRDSPTIYPQGWRV